MGEGAHSSKRHRITRGRMSEGEELAPACFVFSDQLSGDPLALLWRLIRTTVALEGRFAGANHAVNGFRTRLISQPP